MGAAARRLAPSAAPVLPALRVVTGGRRRARARAVDARGAFALAMTCVLIIAAAGVARVALAAQAAEAAIDSWEIKTELKSERSVTRTLESDRSALAAPSRIEALACQTLNMDRPVEVCYLALTTGVVAVVDASGETIAEAGTAGSVDDVDPAASASARGRGSIVSTIMELAAGEAQVLLVGDMGLGQAR